MKHHQKMLATAIEFATACHKDQFDHGGFPYILHPLEVMRIANTDNEEQNCVCVLHDVIEDAFIRYFIKNDDARAELEEGIRQLKRIGMSQAVIHSTVLLTKVPWKSENQYYLDLMEDRMAFVAKRADLQHNMTVSRLRRPMTDKEIDRLANYARRFSQLEVYRTGNAPVESVTV